MTQGAIGEGRDFIERFAAGAALNPDANLLTYYGGGAEGYTDFPAMEG